MLWRLQCTRERYNLRHLRRAELNVSKTGRVQQWDNFTSAVISVKPIALHAAGL